MKRLWSITLTLSLTFFCALINLSAQKIELSKEEKAWLAQNHTIRVSFSQHPPYIYMKDGRIVGIVADLLDEISKHSGLTFQFQDQLNDFSQNLKGLKGHEGPDLIGALMPTTEREKEILFTQAYITSANFIFTRLSAPPCTSMESLSGKKVAVVKDY